MITDRFPGFKPLLSAKLDWSKLKYPVLTSPKFDGIRALCWQGQLYSRTLKKLPNRYIQYIARDFASGLDGEIIVGNPYDTNCMQNTSSGVMSFDGKPNFTYYVFDAWGNPEASFKDRLKRVEDWCEKAGNEFIKVVPHTWCYDEDQVKEQINKWVNAGYEGLMLRNPLAIYKYGRSTANEGILLKHKIVETEWAKVIGFEELMHNENEAEIDHLGHQKRGHSKFNKVESGMLGALIVESPKWSDTFNIGSGFDQFMRVVIWVNQDQYLGRTVEFAYQPHGTMDRPRTPIFKSFREDM
jgi:DNA ligase-1